MGTWGEGVNETPFDQVKNLSIIPARMYINCPLKLQAVNILEHMSRAFRHICTKTTSELHH